MGLMRIVKDKNIRDISRFANQSAHGSNVDDAVISTDNVESFHTNGSRLIFSLVSGGEIHIEFNEKCDVQEKFYRAYDMWS